MIISPFILFLSWNSFISPSILLDSYAGLNSLGYSYGLSKLRIYLSRHALTLGFLKLSDVVPVGLPYSQPATLLCVSDVLTVSWEVSFVTSG